ncbi:ATP-binding protein, partial [Pseudoalteromonas sp. GAB2316C]
MSKSTFKVDTRLAYLLSENYRSPEKALKELVDNAWDAEALRVSISLPEPMSGDAVIVEDDGAGMTLNELQNEYLNVARNRRQRSGDFTPNLRRKVKGRKGIGKFSGLMFAASMTLETRARGKQSTFCLDRDLLESSEGLPEMPLEIVNSDVSPDVHGTRINLAELNQSQKFPNENKLKQVLIADYGREEGFEIVINGKSLGVDDLQGEYKEESIQLSSGEARLRCTVSDQKRKLRKPGITVRIDGKVVGDPS